MGVLKELFTHRIELPDGGHADCRQLTPEQMAILDAQEAEHEEEMRREQAEDSPSQSGQ